MTILITGGAGFIGSNFIPYYLNEHQDVKIVNLDKLTYAGELSNLDEVSDNNRHVFIKGDICNRDLIEELFNKYDFRGLFISQYKCY